jgi:hypothetical protein
MGSFAPTGSFDARYLAFLETIAQLRPRLHRYCSRMTGSVMDGEEWSTTVGPEQSARCAAPAFERYSFI